MAPLKNDVNNTQESNPIPIIDPLGGIKKCVK